ERWYEFIWERGEHPKADRGQWYDRIEVDHANLRSALGWALQHDVEAALRLTGAIARFWGNQGHYGEGRRWLSAALAAPGAAAPSFARARAFDVAGTLAMAQGDFCDAVRFGEEALALRRALRDRHGTAKTMAELGLAAWHQGQLARAEALLAESL